MGKRRTDQEWKNLFEQYESSQLSQRVFCERHSLSLSTFYAKRQLRISEHSEQPFRYDPNTYFGLIRTYIPRLSEHF
jgi:hypothetical protein